MKSRSSSAKKACRRGSTVVALTFAAILGLPRDLLAEILEPPLEDTFINLNTDVNATDPQLNLYTWPAQSIANAILIKADIAAMPFGAVLNRATLHLYLVDWDSNAEPTYSISAHRIINVDPVIAAATGHTYDGTNPWTANTCCSGNVPLAQADIANAVDSQPIDKQLGFKTLDITPIVRHWLAVPSENYGLLVNADSTAGADGHRYFASSEAADSGRQPVLELDVTLAGSDGGGGDADFTGALAAGCTAGEYYDLLDRSCHASGELSRGCAAGTGGVGWFLVVSLFCRRKRARRAALDHSRSALVG